MTRYLVTGAAGFIGANVAQALLDAGHEVVGHRQSQ
jgi:UDP-glucuronate 4-epimerase